jgi:hypothetical protein
MNKKATCNRSLPIILALVLVMAFTIPITLTTGIVVDNAYAVTGGEGDIEDCDGDGYNDWAPYQPVPWRGYDTTRGDPYSFPSDWDGRPGSYYEGGRITQPSQPEPPAQDPPATPNNNDTATSGNSGTSSSGSNANTGSNAQSSTGSGTNGTNDTSNPVATTSDDDAKNDDSTKETTDEPKASEDSTSEKDAIAQVVAAKGVLEVTLPEGVEAFYPGDTVTIEGRGFAKNIKDFEIEIHSDPLPLGKVTSASDGSFKLVVTLPANLEAGQHSIVVIYKDNEIVSKGIEIALSQPADSASAGIPLPALIVLIGAIIVVGLLVVGVKTGKLRSSKPPIAPADVQE